VQPVGVLSGGDQELSGDVGGDPVEGEQAGVDRGDQWFEQGVELGDLDGELLVASGEAAQRDQGGGRGVTGAWAGRVARRAVVRVR
jgi:hypothetical protein